MQNKPVDREDIKTKAQRNKDLMHKLKQQAIQEEKMKRKFNKDIENMDKLSSCLPSEDPEPSSVIVCKEMFLYSALRSRAI